MDISHWEKQIKNEFVFPMMVKNNICCFGDIIGKTDLCNEIAFSKLAILAILGSPGSSFAQFTSHWYSAK